MYKGKGYMRSNEFIIIVKVFFTTGTTVTALERVNVIPVAVCRHFFSSQGQPIRIAVGHARLPCGVGLFCQLYKLYSWCFSEQKERRYDYT